MGFLGFLCFLGFGVLGSAAVGLGPAAPSPMNAALRLHGISMDPPTEGLLPPKEGSGVSISGGLEGPRALG